MSTEWTTYVEAAGDGATIVRLLGEKKYKHPVRQEFHLEREEFLEFAETVSDIANSMVGDDLP
ncbi:MAG: hypothetical protein SPK00_03325 [Corynebacterium glucuronolyticum]|nr:hypothetical protein [Mycobacteriaceae bacterium]MDY5833768.1 hypothetical protein [Corynebacterium glucuronolyticum]